METMDKRLEESGIRKILKVNENFLGGITKWLNENEIRRLTNLIDNCCDAITNEDSPNSALRVLADEMRGLFESDCCIIGKVDEGFVEECVISWEKGNRIQERDLKSVKRFSLNNQNYCICMGLKSIAPLTYFDKDEIINADYRVYETVLSEVRNTTIIPIRNNNNGNIGFIQFINSKHRVQEYDIKQLYKGLLKLILHIHRRDELIDAQLFKKDSEFLSKVQKKINNVDLLLHEIMQYLSKEFCAGVVSYRIPLLVGTEKRSLFFLRDCFIREEIAKYYSKGDYFKDRLIRDVNQMGGYDKLTCKKSDLVIIDKAKDSDYYNKIFNENIRFREDTLIIPVLREYSEKDECFHPQNNEFLCDDETNCPFRFAKYFGVFKLRILSISDNKDATEWLSEEKSKRLSNIAKHISILLNAFVEKYENKSLDVFQKELKGTSFTKIKEFDEQCSRILKKAIQTRNCAIYRYKNDKLILSASYEPISDNFNEIIKKYCKHTNDFVKALFAKKEPAYFVRNDMGVFDSIMVIPMVRKDNSKLGIIILMGKEDNFRSGNLSKTFWEHDKKHIEFIVDLLTRIEESDSERLTFLSQLSHELLRPLTEMVSRNSYHISTAMRNSEVYSKKMLLDEMQKNVDTCMMFKDIIDDTEFIYSLSKGDVQYDFEMIDLGGIIHDAIKLFEEEAFASKQITIKTYLKNMPEKLFVDKSRMRQVVINLLKNAIQYSFPNEEIIISYEYNEKCDCYEINFINKGIPVNPKDNIFDLFVRSKQAVEKRPNGTGIGLYLVKQIMNAHGGDCFVKKISDPTTFTIQIPNKNIQL